MLRGPAIRRNVTGAVLLALAGAICVADRADARSRTLLPPARPATPAPDQGGPSDAAGTTALGDAGDTAAASGNQTPLPGTTTPSIQPSLGPYGDPGGVRAYLLSKGIAYQAIYTGEVFSNLAGGIKRGSVYEGKFELNTTWDLEKLAGLKSTTFFANAFQIQPTAGISRNFVGNFQTISAIEALPATRLSEFWVEKKFLDDKLGIRVGQLAADAEYFISTYSLPFINSDWPAITKQNLPSGGPAYPLSTPGVRVRLDPTPNVSILAAAFNGDPGGPQKGLQIGEERNRTGTRFPLNDPAFLMQEVQYRYNQGADDAELAGIVRAGAWQHLGKFSDDRFGTDNLSLANPLSNGTARLLKGNWGVYGIIDQQLWRKPGGDASSGVTAFSRISMSPSDRNPVQFYLDGGLVFTGMIPGRPDDDVAGITFLYSQVSKSLSALDRQAELFTGTLGPVRDREVAVELTYITHIRPGWTLQPDLQYIFHPGGYIPRPDGLGGPLKNATVIGLRTTIIY